MFRLTTFRRYLTTTARRLNTSVADAPAAAAAPRPALRITHVDAPAAAAAPRPALRITHVDATNFGRPPRPRNDGGAPRFTSNDRPRTPRGPRPATDGPRRPPPRSARGARSEAAKPSQARFTAANQAASSVESSSSSSSSATSGPLLPVPKEQPYVPSALTAEDLLPDVPSTALTTSGLSSALIRETAALRRSSSRNFAGYQRRRAGVMKTVVEGRYQKLLGTPQQQGKVLDEARRLVARNGSIPNAAKVAVVKDVKAMVGELALAAPQERAKIAAA